VSSLKKNRFARRHVALPSDHGSWVFLLSPLTIGLFVGGRWTTPCLYLVIAALSGFLVRQPVTIAVKVLAGRRSRDDLPAALFWTLVYAGIGSVHVYGLVLRGFGYLLYLSIPGMAVFAWYLWLVSRREERGQITLEMLATGVLALTAPAGYWAGLGRPDQAGWLLWLLTWAQSGASVVFVHLRIAQRRLASSPDVAHRLRDGAPSLIFTGINLAAVAALGAGGVLPRLLFVPYGVQFAEGVRGALQPAIGAKPKQIGVRQLLVSAIFTLLFVVTWLAGP
jgi:hypothetical protein